MVLFPKIVALLATAFATLPIRAGAAESALPDLGAAWFGRLRSPETRVSALREWFQASGELRDPELAGIESSLESFAAMHRSIRVLRAPQPGLPEAWLVWWIYDPVGAHEILVGPDPDAYPPASSRNNEDALAMRNQAEGAWRPGDPFLEPIGAFLTNAQGKTLRASAWLGSGAIVDADGDGMLDWIGISRLLLSEKRQDAEEGRGQKQAADLVSIGPIDTGEPRTAAWLVNLGAAVPGRERLHRLALRQRTAGDGMDVLLVPNEPEKEAVRDGAVLQPGQSLPEVPGLVTLGPGEPKELATVFAKERFGWTKVATGWGSADPELDAAEPRPATLDRPGAGLSVPPGLAKLAPDAAARALVDHNRDDVHRTRFDLVLEPPLPETPQTGWVEVVVEPGWADSSLEVWWLREEDAECWICRPMERNAHFAVSSVAREPLAHWIAILAHLERVRSVPRRAGFDRLPHDRFGGDDHTIVRVRTAIGGPSPRLVEFDPGIPTLWNAVRGPVDRPLAGVLAAVLGNAPPGWDSTAAFERKNVLTEAETWLEPDRIEDIPPPLARHAIRLAGVHGAESLRARLEALLSHWGPESPEETALAAARLERRRTERLMWSPPYDVSDAAERRFRLAIARLRELESQQSACTPSQLRETVLRSLRMLDSRDDRARLAAWAAEKDDPGAEWARQRLEELPEPSGR